MSAAESRTSPFRAAKYSTASGVPAQILACEVELVEDKGGIGGQQLQIAALDHWIVRGEEAVDAGHFNAHFEQPSRQRGVNKPGAAGDQRFYEVVLVGIAPRRRATIYAANRNVTGSTPVPFTPEKCAV
jgi:hypothetical protein